MAFMLEDYHIVGNVLDLLWNVKDMARSRRARFGKARQPVARSRRDRSPRVDQKVTDRQGLGWVCHSCDMRSHRERAT